MKHILILFGAILIFAYCHSKKKTAETKTAAVSVSRPLEIAQKRWPNITSTELAEGKTIFETKCTTCHGAKNIPARSEKSWLHEIADMSPKAKLTAEEKEKLTRYILSFREAYTTTD
jgi:cytochrome c5